MTATPLPKPQLPTKAQDTTLYAIALLISVVALAPLVYVLMIKDTAPGDSKNLAFMPAVNATFNGIATACQIAGYFAIRAKKTGLHKRLMLGAFASSALFFVGYLVYHYVHGDTKYPGTGAMRALYLAVLASHVVLSIALVPMLLVVLYRAFKGTFARHRTLARVTLPIWLYVSVTGVLIFWMLKAATG